MHVGLNRRTESCDFSGNPELLCSLQRQCIGMTMDRCLSHEKCIDHPRAKFGFMRVNTLWRGFKRLSATARWIATVSRSTLINVLVLNHISKWRPHSNSHLSRLEILQFITFRILSLAHWQFSTNLLYMYIYIYLHLIIYKMAQFREYRLKYKPS